MHTLHITSFDKRFKIDENPLEIVVPAGSVKTAYLKMINFKEGGNAKYSSKIHKALEIVVGVRQD